jgi:hypothetical protein
MTEVGAIGLDLANNVLQAHSAGADMSNYSLVQAAIGAANGSSES